MNRRENVLAVLAVLALMVAVAIFSWNASSTYRQWEEDNYLKNHNVPCPNYVNDAGDVVCTPIFPKDIP